MDFPTFEKNTSTKMEPLEVDPPAFDANDDKSKTPQALLVEQQWRDLVRAGTHKTHPLSINRDADQVTNDPYAS